MKGWRSETVSIFDCSWLRANANQVTQPPLSMKYGVDHRKLIIYVIEMLTEQSYIYKVWGCICKVQTNGFWVFFSMMYEVIPWHLSASLTSSICKGTCCLVSGVGDWASTGTCGIQKTHHANRDIFLRPYPPLLLITRTLCDANLRVYCPM